LAAVVSFPGSSEVGLLLDLGPWTLRLLQSLSLASLRLRSAHFFNHHAWPTLACHLFFVHVPVHTTDSTLQSAFDHLLSQH
jgi:hypothetical protein